MTEAPRIGPATPRAMDRRLGIEVSSAYQASRPTGSIFAMMDVGSTSEEEEEEDDDDDDDAMDDGGGVHDDDDDSGDSGEEEEDEDDGEDADADDAKVRWRHPSLATRANDD